jgi:hypothetical protein
MNDPGEIVCMVLGGLFVFAVVNAKAQRVGGWGNYLMGFVAFFLFLLVLGVIVKGCKAVFGG